MIIHANTNSKAFKRGWSRKQKHDLRDFVGHLSLDVTSQADIALLTAMYRYCFGTSENKGSIKVFDENGKEVVHFFYEPAQPAKEGR